MRMFLPLTKVEEKADGTLLVIGIASSEAVDSAGEVISADAMKAAMPDFFKYGTGNLREMHQLSAAGTVDKADVDDAGMTTIEATVVDPVAIAKVKTGTYKGFSIGGGVTGRHKVDKKLITGIRLNEISLVDRPANPDAIITLFKLEDVPMTTAAQLSDKDAVDRLAKMVDDKKLGPQRMVELLEAAIAKADAPAEVPVVVTPAQADPAVVTTEPVQKTDAEIAAEAAAATAAAAAALTEKTIKVLVVNGEPLKKGMYSLRSFAEVLSTIACLATDTAWEAEYEKDASPIPAQLREWLAAGIGIFSAMTAEETAELLAAIKVPAADVVIAADPVGDLQKVAIASQVDELVKAALADPLSKIATLTDQLAKADDRIKHLEKLPAPGKAFLKAVGKGDDVGAPGDQAAQQTEPVLKADGSVDEVATELKKIHQAGGRTVGFR